MKNIKNYLYISLIIFILALGSFSARPVQAETVTIKAEESNLSNWYAACQKVGNNLVRNGFKYGNSGTKHTYKAALSSGRKSNCALFVSWCLQEYGAIDSGDTFYVRGSGAIKKNFGSWGSKVSVIRCYKKASSVSLKPGDIVCWKSIAHTNIYAGRSTSGSRLWYDGGKISTYSGHSGSKFKNTGSKKSLDFLNKRTISYIIRIKNL